MRAAHTAGHKHGEMASALGVSPETVRRWLCAEPGVHRAPAKARAVVIESPLMGRVTGSSPLSLISPSGWRIEGLTTDDIAALLGRLR